MFCENCGKNLLDDAKFCGGCGAKTIPEVDAPIQPITQPVQSVSQPVQPPVAYAPQQNYAPPRTAPYAPPLNTLDTPLGVGQYIVIFLLMCVPLLNIVLLFLWSFGSLVNKNKKNFARASLILFALSLISLFFVGGTIIVTLNQIINSIR